MVRPEALPAPVVLKRAVNADGTLHGWSFWCPGCGFAHQINTTWTFDGNEASPTFAPSVLVDWQEGPAFSRKVCHSFIRSGEIMYLDDCTHELAGKTVPMVDYQSSFDAWAKR